MSELAGKKCLPCQEGTAPLQGDALQSLYRQLDGEWRLVQEHHLEKQFQFDNFRQALDFTNRVGELAEAQNHHPEIGLGWGWVKVTIWSHKINGLTESDFIFAAKTDQLLA